MSRWGKTLERRGDVTLTRVKVAMDVSCHSFVRMARLAEPLMPEGGTLLAMSYHGANKVVPNYNLMGSVKAALESAMRYLAYELGEKHIRVHAVSPGPLKTRAASGLKDFDVLLSEAIERAPIGELVDIDDVGLTAAYLTTSFARRLTGTSTNVDGGLSIMACSHSKVVRQVQKEGIVRSVDPRDAMNAWEQPASQEASYVEKALGLVLLLVLAVGCVLILKPFLTAIFLAVTLSVSTWPLFRRAERLLGGRPTAAALLMTVAIAGLLVFPLAVLGANLADDVVRLSAALRSAVEGGLPPPAWLGGLPMVGAGAEKAWLQALEQGAGLGPVLAPYVGPLREWALHQGASLLSGTLQVVFGIVLAFFLYRDGAYVEGRLDWALSRLGGWRARHVLQAAGATITSVVNGVLGTALVQGILLGFSFWLAGVPGAVVIGALGVILALLPMGLVVLWLPAGLWLMSHDHIAWAAYVMAWNGLIVGSLDNVLRPYLISRGVRMPMVLIFLGVLGGLLAFGIVGVFLGPVLLSVAYTLFQDWGRSAEATPEPA
jgi:predicted PurR-regulated permease PerM